MIKKLRRKFVIVSIRIVFVVFFILALTINIANYININEHSSIILSILSENDGSFPKIDTTKNTRVKKLSPEIPFSTRFFSVKIDNNGLKTANIDKITLTFTQSLDYANDAILNGKKNGFVTNYKYQITQKKYGRLIVFVDFTREMDTLRFFITNTILIFIIFLTAVFVLLMIFSKTALKPIIESYEKQKRFITDASHELKTPLTIISTNVDVLEMYDKENEWTRSIKNQIIRLSQLVTRLVELTRMDEGIRQLHMIDFSLSDAVIESAEPFFALATAQDKKITSIIDKNLSYCGNEESIRQLVCILLENAIKYAHKNSKITLGLQKNGKKYFLTVSNTSENLIKGNLDILFERFYRGNSSRNSETGGYGIGLSIAKAIVIQHKGKIIAHSPDGTSFIITAQL